MYFTSSTITDSSCLHQGAEARATVHKNAAADNPSTVSRALLQIRATSTIEEDEVGEGSVIADVDW